MTKYDFAKVVAEAALKKALLEYAQACDEDTTNVWLFRVELHASHVNVDGESFRNENQISGWSL